MELLCRYLHLEQIVLNMKIISKTENPSGGYTIEYLDENSNTIPYHLQDNAKGPFAKYIRSISSNTDIVKLSDIKDSSVDILDVMNTQQKKKIAAKKKRRKELKVRLKKALTEQDYDAITEIIVGE